MEWYEPLAVKSPNLIVSRKRHPSHWDTHRKIGWPLGTWQRRVVSSYHVDLQLFSTAMGESTTEYIQSLKTTTFYVLDTLSAFFTKLSKKGETKPEIHSQFSLAKKINLFIGIRSLICAFPYLHYIICRQKIINSCCRVKHSYKRRRRLY